MAGAGSFRDDVRALLHARVLDAAWEITTAKGWSAVTMGAVAGRVGISRQHLYHEIGTKQDLGNALVERETDGFLAVMCEQLRAHPADPIAGISAAVEHALEHGGRNALLRSILAVDDPRGETLLPLLTARPDAVLERAIRALRAEAHTLYRDRVQVTAADLDVYVDGIVRLVLSHLTQSTGPPDRAVKQAQWLTEAALPATRPESV